MKEELHWGAAPRPEVLYHREQLRPVANRLAQHQLNFVDQRQDQRRLVRRNLGQRVRVRWNQDLGTRANWRRARPAQKYHQRGHYRAASRPAVGRSEEARFVVPHPHEGRDLLEGPCQFQRRRPLAALDHHDLLRPFALHRPPCPASLNLDC